MKQLSHVPKSFQRPVKGGIEGYIRRDRVLGVHPDEDLVVTGVRLVVGCKGDVGVLE